MPQRHPNQTLQRLGLAVTTAVGYDAGASPVKDPVPTDIDCVFFTIEQPGNPHLNHPCTAIRSRLVFPDETDSLARLFPLVLVLRLRVGNDEVKRNTVLGNKLLRCHDDVGVEVQSKRVELCAGFFRSSSMRMVVDFIIVLAFGYVYVICISISSALGVHSISHIFLFDIIF